MIIKSNKNVYKNYFGEGGISKIYAGEKLVFGHEEEIDYSSRCFGLTAVGNCTISVNNLVENANLSISNNYKTWDSFDYLNDTIQLTDGKTIYFKGNNINGFSDGTTHGVFQITGGYIKAHGNILSLIYGDDFGNNYSITGTNTFKNLFSECTSLIQAPELPATTLASNCYVGMFAGCTSLTEAPELPATTLAQNCYAGMFAGCTSLTEAPELPATRVYAFCYINMFKDCTSLIKAPELPSISMEQSCYASMFLGCTSLTEAPELPATTLFKSCYISMFQGCTSLIKAPVLAASYKSHCYDNMFKNCNNLNYIKLLNTAAPNSLWQASWVENVSSTGTFVVNSQITWDPEEYRGVNGIPEGWTVIKE